MRSISILLVLLFTAACGGVGQSPTSEPALTSTLIPPTITPSPVPPTATSTPANLPTPVINPTEILPVLLATQPSVLDADSSLVDRDPVASELVRIAREWVARETNLPLQRIQLVDVRAVEWTESSLNCPIPDQVYLPMTINGYRILLKAGEQTHLFHTDVDRVVPCDPADEQLPEGVAVFIESTEEATAEATPEVTAESSS